MGLSLITREEIIAIHTTLFIINNILFASGDEDTAILLVDRTYIYIEKKRQI